MFQMIKYVYLLFEPESKTDSEEFSDLHETLSGLNTFWVVLTQVQLWSAEIHLIFAQLPCTYMNSQKEWEEYEKSL